MKSWVTSKNGYTIYQVLTGRSNSFLVSNGTTYLLVDTGWKKSRSLLLARLEKFGVNSNSLGALILTHAHYDHVENGAVLTRKYGTPCYIQQTEVEYLRNGNNPSIHGTVFVTKLLSSLLENSLRTRLQYEGISADYAVQEKLDLAYLGFNVYLLHTPGHTSGSLSVIVDNEIALVGDAMFGVFKDSVFPPFAQDVQQLVRSWKLLLDTGCSFFLPAHGTINSRELLESQYEKFRRKYNLK